MTAEYEELAKRLEADADKRQYSQFVDEVAFAKTTREAATAIRSLVEAHDTADNALVDRYRDPKTGVFSFPGDVAAIVRRLDAAEAELARLREGLESAVEAEREACAKLAETGAGWIGEHHHTPFGNMPAIIAKAIRARQLTRPQP